MVGAAALRWRLTRRGKTWSILTTFCGRWMKKKEPECALAVVWNSQTETAVLGLVVWSFFGLLTSQASPACVVISARFITDNLATDASDNSHVIPTSSASVTLSVYDNTSTPSSILRHHFVQSSGKRPNERREEKNIRVESEHSMRLLV